MVLPTSYALILATICSAVSGKQIASSSATTSLHHQALSTSSIRLSPTTLIKTSQTEPVTIADTSSAIASVLAAFSAQSPRSSASTTQLTRAVTGSPITHKTSSSTLTTFVRKTSSSAIGKSSSTTTSKVISAVQKPKTTTKANISTEPTLKISVKSSTKSAAKAVPKSHTTVKAKTTTKKSATRASLHARAAATTIPSYGNCGIGSPVTSTNDCVNGWTCAYQNSYYYQCQSATSSYPTISSSKMTTSSTTSSTSTTTTATTSTTTSTTAPTITSATTSKATSTYQISTTTSSPTITTATTPVTTTAAVSSISPSTTIATFPSATSSTLAPTTRATSTSSLASTTSSSSSIVDINSACAAQPTYGYTYKPQVSTPGGFLSDVALHSSAMTASAPSGYQWAFAGFYASLNQAGYLFYSQQSAYNQTACARTCDSMSSCAGFAIYYERDPILQPGTICPNPDMQTAVICTFYSQHVDASYATNIGEWRSNFAVVIAGANGYNKL